MDATSAVVNLSLPSTIVVLSDVNRRVVLYDVGIRSVGLLWRRDDHYSRFFFVDSGRCCVGLLHLHYDRFGGGSGVAVPEEGAKYKADDDEQDYERVGR